MAYREFKNVAGRAAPDKILQNINLNYKYKL